MWHCHLAAHKNKKTTKAKLSYICLDSSAVERRTHIPEVEGSNPSRGTNAFIFKHFKRQSYISLFH